MGTLFFLLLQVSYLLQLEFTCVTCVGVKKEQRKQGMFLFIFYYKLCLKSAPPCFAGL